MSQNLLSSATFPHQLLRIDHDIATQAGSGPCAYCEGPLHVANYPRKPRGWLSEQGNEHSTRFSFCCGREGCRRRLTPPSVRFLGRRVYLGAVVVLVTALHHGATPRRVRRLQELLEVDLRTIIRWREWWLEDFPATPLWQSLCGRFDTPVDPQKLPASLLARFTGSLRERLVALLRFLAPITTGSWPPCHAR